MDPKKDDKKTRIQQQKGLDPAAVSPRAAPRHGDAQIIRENVIHLAKHGAGGPDVVDGAKKEEAEVEMLTTTEEEVPTAGIGKGEKEPIKQSVIDKVVGAIGVRSCADREGSIEGVRVGGGGSGGKVRMRGDEGEKMGKKVIGEENRDMDTEFHEVTLGLCKSSES